MPYKLKNVIVYDSPMINTPFHKNIKLTFADLIATSRPSPLIEKYILSLLPYYSNTHSNAYCGILMKDLINDTKNYIRKSMNISNDKKIIFTGTGTTCAINHLIYCLNLEKNAKVNIFVSSIEHHSNYLPWVELSKKYKHITFNIIPSNDNFDIDTDFIENSIKNTCDDTINIVSISACSNVIGVKTDIRKIYDTLQKYNGCNCCYGKKNLLFVDYACSAPYVRIDGNYCDGLMFSPHKFIGGHSTPGILIANKNLFHNKTPFTPGGGCVKSVCRNNIEYDDDIEKKETAGTPNILGIIKIKKILQLKNLFMNVIEHNEKEICKYVFMRFNKIMQKHSNVKIILPNEHLDNRLPILCMSIDDVHYNLVVCLLNDMFGIQTRGGVSCTGILAELIQNTYGINGWCRITFNWLMDKSEIDYIIDSVEYIINNVDEYKYMYMHDNKTNLFIFKKDSTI